MPESGEIDVAHVARLARLNLTAEETTLFQEQLHRVLEYAEKLREAEAVAAGVSPARFHGVAAGVSPARICSGGRLADLLSIAVATALCRRV